ncbi:hypothetical protein ABT144_05455 [Streptomyces sp. NPDC002039]|uniref:hypothetical protein n=1 Tax=unclassified Streptomyces TaxID=2593676 RepID=UPI0033215EF6
MLPAAAIVDARSVKAAPNASEESRGFDGGKKVKGRRRRVATGSLGLLLVLIVTAARPVTRDDPLGHGQLHDHPPDR